MTTFPFNLGEVKKSIDLESRLKKTTGIGYIPAELIKYGTDKLYEHLTTMFQKFTNGMEVPREWKTLPITLHKMGNEEDCNNYRGIADTCMVSRNCGKNT